MRNINVLLIGTLNSGVVFWRFHNFAIAAYRNGLADVHDLWWRKDSNTIHPWQIDIANPEYSWRITKEMQDWALQADVIIFQIVQTPKAMGLFEAMKDLCPNKPILTEIDDNVISAPVYNPASPFLSPESPIRKLILEQIRKSDAVIVSTDYLREVYLEFNDNIHVVHNAIDFHVWDRVKRRARNGLIIGWAGAMNHDEDVRILKPVIEEIHKRHPKAIFQLVHGAPPDMRELPGVRYSGKSVEIDKYPKFLASYDFDIGLAPLVDNAFNRSKSNLRWLEYSALGWPTVASKVGHFAESITHGQDGFLCNTAQEWVDCIEALIANRNLRYSIGQEARRKVRLDFNIDSVARYYVEILKEVIAKGPVIKSTEEVLQ